MNPVSQLNLNLREVHDIIATSFARDVMTHGWWVVQEPSTREHVRVRFIQAALMVEEPNLSNASELETLRAILSDALPPAGLIEQITTDVYHSIYRCIVITDPSKVVDALYVYNLTGVAGDNVVLTHRNSNLQAMSLQTLSPAPGL